MMDDLMSVPVVSPSKSLAIKQQAKARLQEGMNLDKAADLTAQQQVLLTEPSIPLDLKMAQLKQLNRKVQHWTKKARQPFAMSGGTPGGPEADNDMDAGPTQAMVTALVKTIKQTATPQPVKTIKQTPIIPALKKKRRKADDLTSKPTPTPRRPKRKLPETPLTGIRELSPDSTQRVQRLKAPTDIARPSTSSQSTPRREFGKVVKRGVKEGLKKSSKDIVKNWLDF